MPALLVLPEVMDKEPTLTRTWLTVLALGAAVALDAVALVPVFLFLAWAIVTKFTPASGLPRDDGELLT